MVLRSTRTAALLAAAALVLSACTAPESGDPTDAPTDAATGIASASQTASDGAQEPTEGGADPEIRATSGALVEGMPSVLVPMEDAEIVSSSVQPAGDGQPVQASITMRVDASEDEVLDFYADHFEDTDFEPVDDPASEDGIATQTYHADEGGQLVSLSISEDADGLLVSVGGRVLP